MNKSNECGEKKTFTKLVMRASFKITDCCILSLSLFLSLQNSKKQIYDKPNSTKHQKKNLDLLNIIKMSSLKAGIFAIRVFA